MFVYRIEDETSQGPYFARSINFEDPDHYYGMNHLGIFEDGFGIWVEEDLINIKNYYCGFETMSQLNSWFSATEKERLYSKKFHIAIYEIESNEILCGESQTQIMFKRSSAKLIKTFVE